MPARLSVLATLCMVAAIGALGTGASVGAQQASEGASLVWTGGEAVGASIAHPAGVRVEREPDTLDGTYGLTPWKPGTEPAAEHEAVTAVCGRPANHPV